MVHLGKLSSREGLSPRQVRHARLELVGGPSSWLAIAAARERPLIVELSGHAAARAQLDL